MDKWSNMIINLNLWTNCTTTMITQMVSWIM
ncbi:unnamed protein product, partial [Cylindrotheca closterium]